MLLATAIVENGLDIPSANTILIDRADTFGLAQLYQLRGRVGRSDKPAYAYLLVEQTAALSDIARRRLASIQEFCDLGAGFRIAAKDLEIRGSGNILGGEQSGHIAAVGFETYLSLLEEAIREMRGEEPMPGAVPSRCRSASTWRSRHEYVADESWRMMIYKKVARARRRRGPRRGPARDRRPVRRAAGRRRRLIEYARLRARAERLGVTSITRQAGRVHVRFAENAPVDPERLLDVRPRAPGASLSPARVLTLPAPEGEALLPGPDRPPSALRPGRRLRKFPRGARVMKGRMKRTSSPWRSWLGALGLSGAELVERIVARVNDRLITQSEYDKRLSVALQVGARARTTETSCAAQFSRT